MANLTSLEELYLGYNNIENISQLSNLISLDALSIEGNSIIDISYLSNFSNLSFLLLGSEGLDDISVLENLPYLEFLFIVESMVSDISVLANLHLLETLYLGDSPISDISPLQDLSKLSWLVVTETEVSDISPLGSLLELYWLSLGGNNISDLTSLENLINIEVLFLEDNEISDISPLLYLLNNGGLQEGSYIDLAHNRLNLEEGLPAQTVIQTLINSGVEIDYDTQKELLYGTLKLTIDPVEARLSGARWSVDGGATWHSSGEDLTLEAGTYNVTFKNIDDWEKPADLTITIQQNETAEHVYSYTRHTGKLIVSIDPEEARNSGAQWSIDDGKTWHSSDEEINIETGNYTVTFKEIAGWDTPLPITNVQVTKDDTTVKSGTYSPHYGTLTVTIEPEEARGLGAQWSIDNGTTWHNSGEGLTLKVGTYNIRFKDIEEWYTPLVIANVQITKDKAVSKEGIYFQYGEVPGRYGDIAGNGLVDVNDAILILQHIVGQINIETDYGSDALLRAKVSDDGRDINIGDAILILRRNVGLIDFFPAERV